MICLYIYINYIYDYWSFKLLSKCFVEYLHVQMSIVDRILKSIPFPYPTQLNANIHINIHIYTSGKKIKKIICLRSFPLNICSHINHIHMINILITTNRIYTGSTESFLGRSLHIITIYLLHVKLPSLYRTYPDGSQLVSHLNGTRMF